MVMTTVMCCLYSLSCLLLVDIIIPPCSVNAVLRDVRSVLYWVSYLASVRLDEEQAD